MIKSDAFEVKNKKILVVGMGNSGKAAAEVLLKLGAEVYVQDSKPEEKLDSKLKEFIIKNNITAYLGEVPNNSKAFDYLILSPGVPTDLEFIKKAKETGSQVMGELELAYKLSKGKYVAITGTNGKTTTTTLVGEIFKESGRNTFVVGNIGVAVVSKAVESDDNSWFITEASSFQLETIDEFRPEVSAVLNLTPDHLDRHKTMENYGAAKARVFENQAEGQYCILNYDDKECYGLAEKNNSVKIVPFSRKEELEFGAFIKNGYIVIADENSQEHKICLIDELKIPGDHNLENALAATAIAYFAGIEKPVIAEVLRSFSGVEHRIELCNTIKGVKYVNDSKGTNPDAAIKAIEAMKENIILIAGGYDKNSSFDEFVECFNGRVKAVMLMGKTATKIKESAEKVGFTNSIILEDMEACVAEASRIACQGDVVLLSPACASWDMYSSFEERGKHFKACVNRLER